MNVLFLVLDCLREDAISETNTPHLHDLVENNLSFEHCVTPANWSLPAHASLFTGSWPHEHCYFHREHHLERSPLLEKIRRRDYTPVGVSANIYASSSHGFATGFDRFYETRRPLNAKGLNPFANVRSLQENREPRPRDYFQTFVDAVTHENPLASVENFGRAVALELDRRYSCRQYLPLIPDDKYGFLTRASVRTSEMLLDAFDQRANEDQSLFAFANYMDTHYPYEPPQRYLEAVTNDQYDLESITNIDPDLASSRDFLNEFFDDNIDEEDLSKVRVAYQGEVRSVDDRIGELLGGLEEQNQLDETLVIVTADHGECLGEKELRGERGMGHLPFLNEHLWRVPLIVSHPDIDDISVEQRVSLKSLFDLLTGDLGKFIEYQGRNYDEYFDEKIVFFELPANPYHESSLEKYEHIPDWYVEREAKTHTVLGFEGNWRVATDSQGNISAWLNKTTREPDDAPEHLISACRDAVNQFPDISGDTNTIMSETLEQQLEDLGYM